MESSTFVGGVTVPSGAMEIEPGSLYAALEGVSDGRKRRGQRYSLALVLTLIVLAKLAGQTKMKGIAEWARWRRAWLCEVLALTRPELPCANTYTLVSGKVNLDELNSVLAELFGPKATVSTLASAAADEEEAAVERRVEEPARGSRHLALDGKSLRGTSRQGALARDADHLVGLYDITNRAPVDQRLASKGTEQRAARAIITNRDLRGVIVSADALHTHQPWARQLRTQGGDYLLFAKANQPTLRDDIALLFSEPCPAWLEEHSATTVNKGHGRLEIRTLRTSPELADYLAHRWPDVAQVFQLERSITRHGKTTHELVYGLTSLPPSLAAPQRLLALLRAHWHIENRLHWRRDVTLQEDACRVTSARAPQVLAALNNAVLALMDRLAVSSLPAKMRQFDAYPNQALALLLTAL